MCERAIEEDSYNLKFLPDHFKTKKMCDNAVCRRPWSLEYVPDWFVTREWTLMWYEDDDEDKFFKRYDDYQGKAQKASIKEELMPIAWHPSRY